MVLWREVAMAIKMTAKMQTSTATSADSQLTFVKRLAYNTRVREGPKAHKLPSLSLRKDSINWGFRTTFSKS